MMRLLFGGVVRDGRGQSSIVAEIDHRSVFRPVDGRIVDGVAGVGKLSDNPEFDGSTKDSIGKFLEQIIGTLCGRRVRREMIIAGFGNHAVATESGRLRPCW